MNNKLSYFYLVCDDNAVWRKLLPISNLKSPYKLVRL